MKDPKKSGAQRARSAKNAAQSTPKSTDAEARKLIETITQQAQEIENLKWKLKKKSDHLQTIQKMVFGRSSEKTRKVTERGISAKTKTKQKSNATKKNTKGGKETRNRAFSSSLRREMRIVEPDPKQFCPCGCGHRTFKTDIRSRLHYKPAEYYVVESHYPKYVCPACNKLVQAKSPKRLLGQSPFGEDVIAQIVVAKFSDFLPYYRLENITERAGHRISRQTMHKRMEELSDKLLWLNLALRKDIKGSSVLCMDETTIPVIQRGRGEVKRCYGWAVKRDHTRWCGNEPPAIVYVFKESRAGYNAVEILEGFSGHLHVDGYAGYNPLTEEDRPEGPVGLIHCWTHVRRRFERVIEKDGSKAAEAIKEMIDNLNNIENKFIGKTHTARLEARTRKSKPIVDRIFRKCESLVHQIPEKSNLRKEINYTLNLRQGLTKFLEDGRFDFDNNLVENSIRKIAIGRNNFMFAGSIKGAEVWLAMTSICETCRLNRVSPELYFGWVLGSINEDVIKLLEQDTLSKKQERELLKFFDKLLPWNCPVGRY